MFCVEEHKWDHFTRIYIGTLIPRIYIGALATRPHLGGCILTWGRRVPEAADKIAVYRVKVFLFELF